jgi:hypothetical protein
MEIGIQRHDCRLPFVSQFEDFRVLRARHSEFADVIARPTGFSQEGGRVARYALIENQWNANPQDAHAAGVSTAASSKLAAAKARACRTSSASNSG